MAKLAGIFILGILVGWIIEWIVVRLFVPNPKKKVETALQASRKENDNLQKQNRELQSALDVLKAASATAAVAPAIEAETKPTVTVLIPAKDDLTKLSGIGPKLAEAMHKAGISGYAQLAELSVETLGERLASSGIRYNKTLAESWAKQANLAEQQNWVALKAYQATLKN